MTEPVPATEEVRVEVSVADLLLALEGWGIDDPPEGSMEARNRLYAHSDGTMEP